jgi:hypothetical protein
LLLGAFSTPSSSSSPTYYVLQNQDFSAPALFTLSFADGLNPQEIDPITGDVIPLLDDAPLLLGMQLSVQEGDARLIMLK